MPDPRLEQVLRHPGVWQARRGPFVERAALSTGFRVLDEALPGGGWAGGALMEVLLARQGFGELGLLAPALAAVAREGRWLAWIDPPHVPYPPALTSWGIDLARMLVVRAVCAEEGLWAAEQALGSAVCGAVLAWSRDPAADGRVLRRLQLAAEAGGAWGVLFRPARCAVEPSPAPVRLLIEPAGSREVVVNLLKCRGRGPGAALRVRPGEGR